MITGRLALPRAPNVRELFYPPPSHRSFTDEDDNDGRQSPSESLCTKTYPRLSKPRSATEPSLYNSLNRRSPAYVDYTTTDMESRAFYLHEVFAMTQELDLATQIPGDIWARDTNYNDQHMAWKNVFKRYTGIETRGLYRLQVLKGDIDETWDLGLFGKTRNALTPVLRLVAIARTSNAPDCTKDCNRFLMHVVSMICLQFYLMERNRFLEVNVPSHDTFYDADYPYLFMLMQRYDIKQDPCDALKEYMYAEKIAEAAHLFDFTSFVVAVLNHIREPCRRLVRQWTEEGRVVGKDDVNFVLSRDAITEWCHNKAFNNLCLYMHTSRFIHSLVNNYEDAINSSVSRVVNQQSFSKTKLIELERIKFFPNFRELEANMYKFKGKSPLNNDKERADLRNKKSVKGVEVANLDQDKDLCQLQARIPILWCHMQMAPDQPLFILPEAGEAAEGLEESEWNAMNISVSNVDKHIEWQDHVLNACACFFDRTLREDMHGCLNRVYKHWRDMQRGKIKAREKISCYPSLPFNPVRIVYSFTVPQEQAVTGMIARIHESSRQIVHAEWSPITISKPAWRHMLKQAHDSYPDPIRYHGPISTEPDDAEDTENYIEIHWPILSDNFRPHKRYYVSRKLQIYEHTVEYNMICCYIAWRSKCKQREWHRPERPYLVFQALCLLYENEANAAVRFKYEMSIQYARSLSYFTDGPVSAEATALSSPSDEELLRMIVESYERERRLMESIRSDAGLIEKYPSLKSLFEKKSTIWTKSAYRAKSIPTDEEWKACMTVEFYQTIIIRYFNDVTSWQCSEDNMRMMDVINLISHHLANGEDSYEVPMAIADSFFSNPLGQEMMLTFNEFVELVVDRLDEFFVNVSAAWRYFLPSSAIPIATTSEDVSFSALRQQLPITYHIINQVMKKATSKEFDKEITKYASRKHNNEATLKNGTEDVAYTALNAIRFIADNVNTACTSKPDTRCKTIETITVLCAENGKTMTIDMKKAKLQRLCFNQLCSSLHFYGKEGIMRVMPDVIDKLSTEFHYAEIAAVIINLMNTVPPEYKPHIQYFRQICCNMEPALIESYSGKEKLLRVMSAEFAKQSQLTLESSSNKSKRVLEHFYAPNKRIRMNGVH